MVWQQNFLNFLGRSLALTWQLALITFQIRNAFYQPKAWNYITHPQEKQRQNSTCMLFLFLGYRLHKKQRGRTQLSKSRPKSVWVRLIFQRRHFQGNFNDLVRELQLGNRVLLQVRLTLINKCIILIKDHKMNGFKAGWCNGRNRVEIRVIQS